ncbi:MAG TPA: TraR/DksA family transcriptional regulator [Smithellaceae bacterium]|nr:TraR/DksA family transcriptional regulator [Smithellaceae bacterium]HRS90252.1 TraR/DksA family transcriptional regulator [Smithellaceae bacterium]HRV27079.1 TraR/DksA family transcriptional regulator [Smithellaceae bacterium]
MQQEKIQHIKNFLLKKMDELRNVAGNTLQRLKNNGEKYADVCDAAAYEYSKAIDLAVRGKERNMMLDIQETIMRIDRGLFGICDHCGRKIPEERMIGAPLSKLCLPCQMDFEKRNGMLRKRFSQKVKIKNAY